jgi:predicted transcriptional regulator
MTKIELKSQIVENILQIDDEEFLNEINLMLQMKNEEPKTIILQDWQKKKIEESLKQVERGEFKSSDVVFKEIEQWLNLR